MQRFKFQALATLDPAGPGELPAGQPMRMVVRGRHHDTHDAQMFSALVTNNDLALLPGDQHLVVTLNLIGEHLGEYFDVGDGFALWQGSDVGYGVITRRLFV
jgi:hypothetical protein